MQALLRAPVPSCSRTYVTGTVVIPFIFQFCRCAGGDDDDEDDDEEGEDDDNDDATCACNSCHDEVPAMNDGSHDGHPGCCKGGR